MALRASDAFSRERELEVMPGIRLVHGGVDHVAVIVLAEHLLLLLGGQRGIDRRHEEDPLRARIERRRRIVRGGDRAPLKRRRLHHLAVVARRERHDVFVDEELPRARDLTRVRGDELRGGRVIPLHARRHGRPVLRAGIDPMRDVVHLCLRR